MTDRLKGVDIGVGLHFGRMDSRGATNLRQAAQRGGGGLSPPRPSKPDRQSDAELAGDRPHVQLADVARVAALALLGVEDGAAVVGVDAEANAQVARVELCKGEGVKAGGRRRQEVYDTSISSVFLRCFDEG